MCQLRITYYRCKHHCTFVIRCHVAGCPIVKRKIVYEDGFCNRC